MKIIKPWREFHERVFNFTYPDDVADIRWKDFPKKLWIDFGLILIFNLIFLTVALQPWTHSENSDAVLDIMLHCLTIAVIFEGGVLLAYKLQKRWKR